MKRQSYSNCPCVFPLEIIHFSDTCPVSFLTFVASYSDVTRWGHAQERSTCWAECKKPSCELHLQCREYLRPPAECGVTAMASWIWMREDNTKLWAKWKTGLIFSSPLAYRDTEVGWCSGDDNICFNVLFSLSPVDYSGSLKVHSISCLHWFPLPPAVLSSL